MKYAELSEATEIPENAGIDDIMKMLTGVHRGLMILKQMREPTQRLKHANRIFANYQIISKALQKLTDKLARAK